jgi:hypothetical protein
LSYLGDIGIGYLDYGYMRVILMGTFETKGKIEAEELKPLEEVDFAAKEEHARRYDKRQRYVDADIFS